MTASTTADNPAPPANQTGSLLTHPLFIATSQMILSALLLLLICDRHQIYEEDEAAKAAQVTWLGSGTHWREFSAAPDYYRKEVFSGYYLAATAFYKLTGLDAIEALKLFSVVCGGVFFAVTPAFFRRAFGLPTWPSWIALAGIPVLTTTFTYGNETALALAAVASAALALTFDSAAFACAGALGWTVAVLSRSDYLLLGPALLLLVRRPGTGWKKWRLAAVFGVAALVLGAGYLAVVLHHLPRTRMDTSNRNWKLALAFGFYGFNPANLALAVAGLGICLAQRRGKILLALVALVQALPYAIMLTSPKYILPAFVAGAAFTVIGMQSLWRRSRVATVLLLVLPWLVGITPFGIFGPNRAAIWAIPSDHGPVPVGGYAGYYRELKSGFYHDRYDVEYREVDEALTLAARDPHPADLAGMFNFQTLCLWGARHGRWEIAGNQESFWDALFMSEENGRPKLVPKTAYLHPRRQNPAAQTKFEKYLEAGCVAARTTDADPFPDVIQAGLLVPPQTDTELGKRILFMTKHYSGEQALRSKTFDQDLLSVSWLPHSAAFRLDGKVPKPIYVDSQWVCFSEPMPGAVYYSLRFPHAYSKLR